MLTPVQMRSYETEGYLVFDPGFPRDLLAEVRQDLEARLAAIRDVLKARGKDERRRETDADLHWKSAAVRRMLTADPFLELAATLLGGDVDLSHSITLTKTADHGEPVLRHQDWGLGSNSGHPLFTLWIAITDSNAGNGCLEVLPGSHAGELFVHTVSQEYPSDKGIPGFEDVEALPVPMKAGEAMIIHPALIHGSGKNLTGSPRLALLAGFQKPKPAYDEFWGKAGAKVLRNGRPDWGALTWI